MRARSRPRRSQRGCASPCAGPGLGPRPSSRRVRPGPGRRLTGQQPVSALGTAPPLPLAAPFFPPLERGGSARVWGPRRPVVGVPPNYSARVWPSVPTPVSAGRADRCSGRSIHSACLPSRSARPPASSAARPQPTLALCARAHSPSPLHGTGQRHPRARSARSSLTPPPSRGRSPDEPRTGSLQAGGPLASTPAAPRVSLAPPSQPRGGGGASAMSRRPGGTLARASLHAFVSVSTEPIASASCRRPSPTVDLPPNRHPPATESRAASGRPAFGRPAVG